METTSLSLLWGSQWVRYTREGGGEHGCVLLVTAVGDGEVFEV